MSRLITTTNKPDPEIKELKEKKDQGKVLFTNYEGKNCALYIKNDRLLAIQVYTEEDNLLDSIYIARIKDAVPRMEAYFVEIQKDTVCFLPAKHCINPILINRQFDGRILQGDQILVRVIKSAQKTKPPMVSADFSKPKYEPFIKMSEHKSCFTCLKPPMTPWLAALKDLASPEEYTEIITDNTSLYEEIKNCPSLPDKEINIRLYNDPTFSLSKLYSLKQKIGSALERRIWLKSGAYLIIEHTEALNVIDVNSGKYEARKVKNDYAFTINKEACEEIALQMRLRNLSGMILVDLISMEEKEYETKLISYMNQLIKGSAIKTRVVDITPLGLMEITRQKTNRPLREQFMEKR